MPKLHLYRLRIRSPSFILVIKGNNSTTPPGVNMPQTATTFAQAATLLGVAPIVASVGQMLALAVTFALWAVAIADTLAALAAADPTRRIQQLAACGYSKAAIARSTGATRYRVARVLATR